jgi:uncharacterized protein YozE (UPF0346 family)
MDETATIKNILKEVGLAFIDNELILKEEILKLSSDMVIRIKELLDLYKKNVSCTSYRKYSVFLNDILKAKNFYYENPELILSEDAFDDTVYPKTSKKCIKIVDGVSIWGLYLNQKNNSRDFYCNVALLNNLLQKYLIKNVFIGFMGLRVYCFTRIRRLKTFKGLLIKLCIRWFYILKRHFEKLHKVKGSPQVRALTSFTYKEGRGYINPSKTPKAKGLKSPKWAFLGLILSSLIIFFFLFGSQNKSATKP